MLESKLKRASRKTHHHAVPLAIQDEEQGFPVTDHSMINPAAVPPTRQTRALTAAAVESSRGV
jgi:hypothetical protein